MWVVYFCTLSVSSLARSQCLACNSSALVVSPGGGKRLSGFSKLLCDGRASLEQKKGFLNLVRGERRLEARHGAVGHPHAVTESFLVGQV